MGKIKIVYFVTLVIKYTELKPIKGTGIPMKTEKITIYQKIVKNSNGAEAYNTVVLEAQQKHEMMRMIAYTVTELDETLFEDVKPIESED